MRGDLQSTLGTLPSPAAREYNGGNVNSQTGQVAGEGANKVNFQDVLVNSMEDSRAERTAQAKKQGVALTGKESQQEFMKKMNEATNKGQNRTPKNVLDKDDFLKLFVTQLQNQNPLDPQDSSEMATQLANFNSLEQMMNMNKTLQELKEAEQTSRVANLISYVGKEVTVEKGTFRLLNNKISDVTIEVPQQVSSGVLKVRDASGTVVADRQIGQLNSGKQKLEFDGKAADGRPLPNGVYTFTLAARSLDGQDVPIDVRSMVKISGVDLKDGGGAFYTEVGKLKIDEISAVGDPGSRDVPTIPGKSTAEMTPNGSSDQPPSGLTGNQAAPPVENASQEGGENSTQGTDAEQSRAHKPEQQVAPLQPGIARHPDSESATPNEPRGLKPDLSGQNIPTGDEPAIKPDQLGSRSLPSSADRSSRQTELTNSPLSESR